MAKDIRSRITDTSKVKEYINSKNLMTSFEVFSSLNEEIYDLLDRAVNRCKSNRRSTVRAADLRAEDEKALARSKKKRLPMLVVVSSVKDYIKSKKRMTAGDLPSGLNEEVLRMLDNAVMLCKHDKRTVVMPYDIRWGNIELPSREKKKRTAKKKAARKKASRKRKAIKEKRK